MKVRREFKLIRTPDEKIIGMTTFEGKVILATSDNIYEISNNEVKVIKFEWDKDETA